jgi:DNA-binding response OmpR family regulator
MIAGDILVVDDDESVRIFLKRALEREGYKATTVNGYLQAQKELKENTFDLLIVDIVMPEKTGIELLEWIHKEGIETPVVMLTGRPDVEGATRVVRAGAFDYLVKPINLDMLYKTVRNGVTKKKMQDHTRRLQRTKEILTSFVIDEIRQNLFTLKGNLDSISSELVGQLDREQEITLKESDKSCHLLVYMVQDLMDIQLLERKERPLRAEEVNLPLVLKGLMIELEHLVHMEDKKIVLKIPEGLSHLISDSELIQRVLFHLLYHSVLHAHSGQEITVVLSRVQEGLQIYISDGRDVPTLQDPSRLFDIDQQPRLKEAGFPICNLFSLPCCKYAIEALGGRIWFASQGVCSFTVLLPYRSPE